MVVTSWFIPHEPIICVICCLGKTMEHSGLDEASFRSGLYSAVVINQIINETHYIRAVEAHEITFQVLSNLCLDVFFTERPTVWETLINNLTKLADTFSIKGNVAEVRQSEKKQQQLLIQIGSMNLKVQLQDFIKNHAIFLMLIAEFGCICRKC